MRISSLVCVAWILLAQLSAADQPGAIPLPPGSQVPKAAQRAGEAPAWNPQAAAVTAAPQQQAQSIPAAATPAAENPNFAQPATMSAPAASVQAAPPGYVPAATAPVVANPAAPPARPLFSVMKRKRQAAEAAAAPAGPQVSVPTNATAATPSAPSTVPQFAAPTNATANAATATPIAAVNPVAEPQSVPSPSSATPATLNTAQTDGALPIDVMPAPPTETATPVAAELPASPVIPANYTETIASPTSLATPNFTAPSTPVEIATPASESASATSQPTLHPTAPVQLIAPPDESARATNAITDPEVTPATSRPSENDSSDDNEQLAAAHAAADLFNQSLVTNASVKLTGKWVTLASIMNGIPESQRLAVVSSYWRLSSAVSNLVWQTDELDRLDKAAPARVLIDNPMISTARAMATARVDEAELNVTKAQHSLANILGSLASNTAILPSDHPLVGPYHTQFQAIFANRPAPGRTREIDTALPILLRIINDHAAAVRSAMDAVHWAEETRARGETDVRTVLACQEDLRRQRRDFLASVLDYNLEIAEYASAVAAPGTPDEKFVSMLIRPKTADRLSAIPERSTFATPLAPVASTPVTSAPSASSQRELNASGQRSRTASDGWVPSSVRPLEAPPPPPEDSRFQAVAPQATPSVVNPINPQGKPDPFTAPSGNDRYGNRYNNRYNESR